MTLRGPEAATLSIGDQLDQMFGRLSTRIVTAPAPETLIGSVYADASSSGSGGTTVTLAGGLISGLAVGQIFRTLDARFTVQTGTAASRTDADATRVLIGDDAALWMPTFGIGLSASAPALGVVTLEVDRDMFEATDVGRRLNLWNTPDPLHAGSFRILTVVDQRTVTYTNAAPAAAMTGFWAVDMEGVDQLNRLDTVTITDEIIAGVDSSLSLFMLAGQVPFTDEAWTVKTAVREAVITAVGVPGPNDITLAGVGLEEDFSNISWEVVQPPDTDIVVESTIDSSAAPGQPARPGFVVPGQVYIQGQRYWFAGTSQGAMSGVLYGVTTANGIGVVSAHPPKTEVIEFYGDHSAIERLRKSFLLRYAEGQDLDVIGARLSLPRSVGLGDDTYRKVLEAVGYGRRGTLRTIRDLCDTILGINGYALFEDLTGAVVGDVFNHCCTVYFARLGLALTSLGKAFMTHEDIVLTGPGPATVDVTVPVPPAGPLTLSVRGIAVENDPSTVAPMRLIESGAESGIAARGVYSATALASGADPIVVQFAAALPTIARIQPGDVFHLKGAGVDRYVTIRAVSGSVVQLGCVEGAPIFENTKTVVQVGEADAISNGTVGIGLQPPDRIADEVDGSLVYFFQHYDRGVVQEGQIVGKTGSTLLYLVSAWSVPPGQFPWRIVKAFTWEYTLDWEILRPISNFRHYLPTVEVYKEYPGDPGASVWTLIGAAAWSLTTAAGIGKNSQMVAPAALSYYEKTARIIETSGATFSLGFAVDEATVLPTPTAGLQFGLSVSDQNREIVAGVIHEPFTTGPLANSCRLGLVNSSTGRFINTRSTGAVTFNAGGQPLFNDGDYVYLDDTRGRRTTIAFFNVGVPLSPFPAGDHGIYVILQPGWTGDQVAQEVVNQIQAEVTAGRMFIYAETGVGPPPIGLVVFTQLYPGQDGDTPISINQGGTGMVVPATSFTGGFGFPGALRETWGRVDDMTTATASIIKPKIVPELGGSAQYVALKLNGAVVDLVPYSQFPSAGGAHDLRFGALGMSSVTAYVKDADWYAHSDQDMWNVHPAAGSLNNLSSVLTAAAAIFVGADDGRYLRIHSFSTAQPGGGTPLGEWQIEEVLVGLQSVDLRGPMQRHCRFNPTYRDEIEIDDGTMPFIWPDHRGHKVQILDGVNAGIYPIAQLLEPETRADLDTLYPEEAARTITSPIDVTTRTYTNRVRLDLTAKTTVPVGEFDGDEPDASWRLVPYFAFDPSVEFEIVGTGAIGGGGSPLTNTRQTWIISGSFVAHVTRTAVLSAHVIGEDRRVYIDPVTGLPVDHPFTPPGTPEPGVFYPFYLWDGWGSLREIIDLLTAAGVIPDFDHLVVDDGVDLPEGAHILE